MYRVIVFVEVLSIEGDGEGAFNRFLKSLSSDNLPSSAYSQDGYIGEPGKVYIMKAVQTTDMVEAVAVAIGSIYKHARENGIVLGPIERLEVVSRPDIDFGPEVYGMMEESAKKVAKEYFREWFDGLSESEKEAFAIGMAIGSEPTASIVIRHLDANNRFEVE